MGEPKNASGPPAREPGLHQIPAITHGFVPVVLDVSPADQVVRAGDQDAIRTTRRLGSQMRRSGGIDSGAAPRSARRPADSVDGPVATVLPDRAERYFSTALL